MQRFRPDGAALERLSRIENTSEVTTEVPEEQKELLGYISEWSLTPEQVAAALRVSTRTLSKLRIPHAKIGMTVRYNPKHVRDYINKHLHAEKAYA